MKAFAVRFGPPLAYQIAWFTLILTPTFILAVRIVRYDSPLRFVLALAVIAAVVFGTALLVRRNFPEAVKVDAEFDHLILVSMFGGSVPIAMGVMNAIGTGWGPGAAGAFVTLCLISLVLVWTAWALGWMSPGMRPPLGFALTGELIVRLRSASAGTDTGAVSAKVIARREVGTKDVIRILLGMRLLPPLSSGERRWCVKIGGDRVGTLTQTPEPPENWHEPLWQVRQRRLFDRGLVEFVPDRTSADASEPDRISRPR
ncbi:hypothetical protein [Glycomyces salinus]|uniref:hypothetical protein n=1 Tax=Glycomyces salinus TaxID=980294 RepID=UPI0018ED8262|nr:hypothetical protein [Glycomyces salinus]